METFELDFEGSVGVYPEAKADWQLQAERRARKV